MKTGHMMDLTEVINEFHDTNIESTSLTQIVHNEENIMKSCNVWNN